ncbi:RNA polymerase-associated protein RapA [Marinibactrum halimedae]|uniref:RNA polymerase-associated protein RapA n=1 Tax=Marinibactrum halimedae TaxID=1444977 RepID=A0AA37T9U3_9GAMM|nr:RNA polymerase-associated protein RapA [Marinibactrum halimedae]MCD9459392.1 RNA polymerase-associated protein RapA [Marinibactrum halimedae]GLS27542.1 RNA polymerase-associated protein RapA [Marinibactrum halimedae]
MTQPTFALGQRWISNAETELGLGMVVDIEERRVTLSFPAAGERRTYFENNAPLTRVRYDIGDTITDLDDQRFTVMDVVEHEDHYLVYKGRNDNGEDKDIIELELNSFVHFSGPQERLFAGNVDKPRRFQLRLDTLKEVSRLQQSGVNGLLGPRVDTLPHQLFIAQEVANRFAPRVLLADEVGLGKTIEAGLIIHQQLHSGRAQRILIAVPDSLVHQWLVEMLRRFNLQFTLLDEARCQAITESESDNPFESTQLVLCSLSLLTENPERADQAAACEWDIFCVDEAHHLQWSEAEASIDYQVVERLAGIARGLLLLTATPEQLGIESHFARLRLLDPNRYHSLSAFQEEEANYQPINDLIQTLLSHDGPAQLSATDESAKAFQSHLQSVIGEERFNHLLQTLSETDCEDATNSIIFNHVRELLDRHGTGRVLFRNTRSSVEGFPERVLNPHPLELPENYSATDLYPEQPHSADNPMEAEWVNTDPRVQWLLGFLKQHKKEKVLLITANANTALALEIFLRLRNGIRSSVFYEDLSLLERDRAAAYFADPEDGAQILLCSEIGSEGRNFQFASHLIMFDLPRNPDLLEQRIGRLDRIGQKNTVNIHVPFFEDSAQSVLLDWFHEGMNGFEITNPAGAVLGERFKEQLANCLENPADQETLDTLIQETEDLNASTLETLQQGRDRLLEMNSCNPEKANEIIDAIHTHGEEDAITQYMTRVFDQFSVEHQSHSESAMVLRPGENMHSHFPELPDDGISVCFNREKSLSREDLTFLTWEHPMVTGAMEMITEGDHGNCSLCTIKLPPLKPGGMLVEVVYVMHCPAPKSLQIGRYLPTQPVRFLIDNKSKDLGHIITSEHITKLAQKVGRGPADKLLKHVRNDVDATLKHAQNLAEEKQKTLVNDAKANMLKQQQYEIDRMEALAKVNPNIRQEEVDHLKEQSMTLLSYLDQVQARLDSVRLVVTT